jgi:hypothetical protein
MSRKDILNLLRLKEEFNHVKALGRTVYKGNEQAGGRVYGFDFL